jgi:hypothetical protein
VTPIGSRVGDILQLPVAIEFLSELVEGKRGYTLEGSRGDEEKVFAQKLLTASLDHSRFMILSDRCMLFAATYIRTLRAFSTIKRSAAMAVIFVPWIWFAAMGLIAARYVQRAVERSFDIVERARPVWVRQASEKACRI